MLIAHAEVEVLGHAVRPTRIGRGAVRAIKRRVDLDGVEDGRVALQVGTGEREARGIGRQRPPRRADADQALAMLRSIQVANFCRNFSNNWRVSACTVPSAATILSTPPT